MRTVLAAVTICALAITAACSGREEAEHEDPEAASTGERPQRFTIAPDDYHVPYAGTAEDGRKFFLSDELFDIGADAGEPAGYVGLFLWNADGSFDEVLVDRVGRAAGVPPGQASSAGADDLVAERLRQLGTYELEPITVEPFLTVVDGVTFGWEVDQYDDGTYYIGIRPGDFIVYYEPWDGSGYDT
ncbi:hypothetical protein L615_001900000750 [Nocardioides sp. J9]|uniref:hypothetical protein n=1 Tax=Nocardioides sp. J54 TaxID=935866 RepID=UPI0004910C09|nr:hypothetical protein [Nocardioides sp. J54]TWH01394.1 hypothetical protein L615_001900000750 [Nocardioides sp. J9]